MHPCLLVPEILCHIFDFLPPWTSKTNASTLIALAVTCKAFQHPALDVLWRDLDDPLLSLIQCLSKDLWVRRGGTIQLQRPFVEADVLTLKSYASRVRTFGIYRKESDSLPDLGPEVLRAINLVAETPLMPNLRSLSWYDKDEENFLYINLFLGAPQLTRIDLDLLEDMPSRLSLLPKLKTLHPSIKEATIDYEDNSEEIEAISSLICSWGSLETLTCGPLTVTAWAHLSKLPTLRWLDATPPAIDLSGIASPFATLRVLNLRCRHSALPCIALLSQMSSDCLKNLTITPLPSFTSANFKEIFDSLCKNMRHLQELSVAGGRISVSHSEEFTIKGDTLKPLFSLPKLVKIHISSNCLFNLDDRTLVQMAHAWPSLKTLILGSDHGWRRRSKLTLKSLLIILAHCPDLQTLGIVIDATRIDSDPTTRPGGGFSHTTLTDLQMGDSKVTNAMLVGAFLSDIVPRVATITAWQAPEMEAREGGKKYQRRWKEVERLLSTFAMVREQERQWSERTRRARIADAPGIGSSMALSDLSDNSGDESSDNSPDP